MSMLLRSLVCAAACMAALPASATYVFTPVGGPPGASSSQAWGINNSGQIVGTSSKGAFLYSGGKYKIIGDKDYSALGINDAGIVAGSIYDSATDRWSGALYNTSTGVTTPIAVPGAISVELRGIANNGDVAGTYKTSDNLYHAFIRSSAGLITTLSSPTAEGYNVAQGLNSFGQVVGSFSGSGSFLYNLGTGVRNDFTLTPGFPGSTRARAINDNGQIAGFYYSPAGNYGFIGTADGYQNLQYGSYATTIVEGLNNAGQVIGFAYNADNVWHSFMATPTALPTSSAGGVYTFMTDVVAGVPIFIDPFVATGYDYAIGAGDPRIGQVRLPNNVGDNIFQIILPDGTAFTLMGGELFDFTAHGFADGVANFSVRGIETGAGLNPDDPTAFITQLVFLGSGTFTGTMAAVVEFVPEPGSIALFALGLAGLGAMRRRRAAR